MLNITKNKIKSDTVYDKETNLYTIVKANIVKINDKTFYKRLVPITYTKPDGTKKELLCLLNSRDYNKDHFIVAMDFLYAGNTQKSSIFATFKSQIDIFNWIKSLPVASRNCYEVIHIPFSSESETLPDDDDKTISRPISIKLFFDVDIAFTKDDINFRTYDLDTLDSDLTAQLESNIHAVLVSNNVPYIQSKHLIIHDSHREGKRSHHYIINGFYHSNMAEVKAFYQLVVAGISPHLHKYVDPCVYKRNQQLRLPGCSKLGIPNFKTISPRTSWIPSNEPGVKYKDIRKIPTVDIWKPPFCGGFRWRLSCAQPLLELKNH